MKVLCFVLITCMCCSIPALAQIHRWVDENGKVHFGDRIPEKYKGSAEPVETKDITIVSPEADIHRKNRQQFQKMENESKNKQKQKRMQEKQQKSAQKRKKNKKKLTKKTCRDRFPNNVKFRTECFKKASANK